MRMREGKKCRRNKNLAARINCLQSRKLQCAVAGIFFCPGTMLTISPGLVPRAVAKWLATD